jgi:hypothetical protein
MNENIEMELGVQPLDNIMKEREIKNHDLVAAAPAGFINHKQVKKARAGRRLTLHMQEKVLEALNACCKAEEAFELKDLFTYRGKKTL